MLKIDTLLTMFQTEIIMLLNTWYFHIFHMVTIAYLRYYPQNKPFIKA